MDQIGDHRYIEIPGSREKKFELPPLLITGEIEMMGDILKQAEEIAELDYLSNSPISDENILQQARIGIALGISEKYIHFLRLWTVGDSMMEWISQCEITFRSDLSLCGILKPNIMPHVGQSNFVRLAQDKCAITHVDLEIAVGLRLFFRQAIPVTSFDDYFLSYNVEKAAKNAFNDWENLTPKPIKYFPPERFEFEVLWTN